MKQFIFIPYFFLTFCVICFIPGCGQQKNKTGDDRSKDGSLTKDTLIGRFTTQDYNTFKDSTDVYGKGNFDYRDTLESWHVGYSIPRDSVYKVWNTQAFKELELQLKKYPAKPGPYLDRGNHFQNIKMYRYAIEDYDEYIKRVQTNHSAYMNRGNAYERLKIYDSAMTDYNTVLNLKPDDTIANFNKGCIYDILSRHDSAVMQYDTVIIKDSRLAKGYYNRGTSYYYLGKIDQTIADWEKAISLNPIYEGELRPRINKLKATGKLY